MEGFYIAFIGGIATGLLIAVVIIGWAERYKK